ncbi:diacylglycerol kinase family protein [Sphingobacterium suaedae]|uniref:Diacylglycerol kinase family protein n=1 Tax=Sphingobacterium suaedae TaxID=1686402 RepID=A0ABW5KC74_9SPHI
MKESHFSLTGRLKSFQYALDGLKTFSKEHNAKIHLFASLLVIALGLVLPMSMYDWIAIIFAIALVLISEMWNTVVEHIADYLTTERDLRIKKIKDISAAAVLVSSIVAVCIGITIFLPKLMLL